MKNIVEFSTLVVGKLMGYDPLLNLVLDETVEYLKGRWLDVEKHTVTKLGVE